MPPPPTTPVAAVAPVAPVARVAAPLLKERWAIVIDPRCRHEDHVGRRAVDERWADHHQARDVALRQPESERHVDPRLRRRSGGAERRERERPSHSSNDASHESPPSSRTAPCWKGRASAVVVSLTALGMGGYPGCGEERTAPRMSSLRVTTVR